MAAIDRGSVKTRCVCVFQFGRSEAGFSRFFALWRQPQATGLEIREPQRIGGDSTQPRCFSDIPGGAEVKNFGEALSAGNSPSFERRKGHVRRRKKSRGTPSGGGVSPSDANAPDGRPVAGALHLPPVVRQAPAWTTAARHQPRSCRRQRGHEREGDQLGHRIRVTAVRRQTTYAPHLKQLLCSKK